MEGNGESPFSGESEFGVSHGAVEKSSDTNLPHGQFHGRVRIERLLGTVKTVNALDKGCMVWRW